MVCPDYETVCPDYETLPAAQVAPLHHLPHQDRPDAPQQDRQLPAHHEIERRYGLRRVLLQQRHLQAQEDQPIHTVENDDDEDEPPEQHQEVDDDPYGVTDHIRHCKRLRCWCHNLEWRI